MRKKHRYQWIPVESAAFSAFGYSGSGNRLAFKFAGGSEYEYEGVGDEVIRSFLASESKGRFFASNIRNAYPFTRVA